MFDMAGTTVQDHNEVLDCFLEAARRTGIETTPERVNTMMGWSKIHALRTLWTDQLGAGHAEIETRAQASFEAFREVLENHYHTQPVLPTEGALETFAWCRANGIKIALDTGFYRAVTDIILNRLGWTVGASGTVDFVIASDEVPAGRPAPFMIFRAMEALGVADVRQVVKIGDTPSDLQEGRNAGCRFTIGLTNGTHTAEQLVVIDHDILLGGLGELPGFLEQSV